MKEFVDKLIGRLEELQKQRTGCSNITCDKCKYDKECFEGEKGFKVTIDKFIKFVNELAEEYNNDFCEWKFTKSVVNGGYFYSSGCNHKRFSDLHNFEFCPYCGKKIKVVTIDG